MYTHVRIKTAPVHIISLHKIQHISECKYPAVFPFRDLPVFMGVRKIAKSDY